MVLSEVDDDGNEQGESLLLISLENGQEVIVLEEAHGSVGHLQMGATDASHYPSEELSDERLDLVHLAHFEDLLELGEEQSLLHTVSEGPELKETFQQRDCKVTIFGEEKH